MENKGRKLAYLLRHHPEEFNLEMDSNGYVEVSGVLSALNLTSAELEVIVRYDSKKRFSVSGTKIRANQGHSFPVELDLEVVTEFPIKLYHGTAYKNLDSINKFGIKKGKRQFVHLSSDINVAKEVGLRHSKVISLLEVTFTGSLGEPFLYISENGVYLCDNVPNYMIRVL